MQRLFVPTDQLEVADTENNRQPYLQDFENLGPQAARASPAIDLTDDNNCDAGGGFRVVGPRQVFPRGELHFLLSIIPSAANRVMMSVVIASREGEAASRP